MSEDISSGAIYTEFDETRGPNPVVWEPSDLADHIQKLISFKTLSMFAGEEHIVPEELVIIPFPSLNSKALVKFVGWKDDSRRGGIGIGSISLLFKEFDDLIFYKIKYLKKLLHPKILLIGMEIHPFLTNSSRN